MRGDLQQVGTLREALYKAFATLDKEEYKPACFGTKKYTASGDERLRWHFDLAIWQWPMAQMVFLLIMIVREARGTF